MTFTDLGLVVVVLLGGVVGLHVVVETGGLRGLGVDLHLPEPGNAGEGVLELGLGLGVGPHGRGNGEKNNLQRGVNRRLVPRMS